MEDPKQQILAPHKAEMEALAREGELIKEKRIEMARLLDLAKKATAVRSTMKSAVATPEFFTELEDMFANGLIKEDVYNTLLEQVNFAIDLIIKATGGRGFIADDSPTQEI